MLGPLAHSVFTFGTCLPAASAVCDLQAFSLPERRADLAVGNGQVQAYYGGKFDFDATGGGIYKISEVLYGKLPNGKADIEHIVRSDVEQKLPNDECGSQAAITTSDANVIEGILQVTLTIEAKQWGCFAGVKAEIAAGEIGVKLQLKPEIKDNTIAIVASSSHWGDVENNIPDIDSDLTETIENGFAEATNTTIEQLKTTTEEIQHQMDDILKNINDNPDLQGNIIYKPVPVEAKFRRDQEVLYLILNRESEAREGTSCTIKRVVQEKWDENK